MNMYFLKEDLKMANRYLKNCSSLMIRKMLIKITLIYDLILVRIAHIKKSGNSLFVELYCERTLIHYW